MAGGWGVNINGFDSATDTLESVVEGYGQMGTYTVKTDVHYAIYVEFGTVHMPANGAMRAAIDEVMNNLGTVIGDATGPEEITKNVAEAIQAGWRRDVWVDTGNLRDSIHVAKVGG